MNHETILPRVDDQDILADNNDTCYYCGSSLTTEVELINMTCLACFYEDEREAKLRAFDDLVAACRGLLYVAPEIAPLLPVRAGKTLEHQVDDIRNALCYAGVM